MGDKCEDCEEDGENSERSTFFVVAQHVKIMDNQLVDEFRHDLIEGYGRLGRNPWV